MAGKRRRIIKPLVPIVSIWERNSVNRYPDLVRIPMNNGHVITYRMEIDQPGYVKPENTKYMVTGYPPIKKVPDL